MPGATLPSTDALVTWTDNTDNWRSQDADFLQRRSILRFTTSSAKITALGPSLSIPSPTAGQAVFVSQTDSLEYIDSSGTWRKVNAFKNATFDDTSTGFGMRLSSDASNPLLLEAGKVVLGANRGLVVTGSSVQVKTGTATATLTTNSTSLLFDTPISVPSASLGSATATGLDVGAGLVSSGSLLVYGQATLGSLTSGATALGVTSATSVTATNLTATTLLTAATGRMGQLEVSYSAPTGSSIYPIGSSVCRIRFLSDNVTVAGNDITLSPTATTTAVRHGNGLPFATVLVSTLTPVAAEYPEGTLWVQP